MNDRRGFTLTETMMVLSLIGILVALSTLPIGDSIDQAKYDRTLDRMKRIRAALIGEPQSPSKRSSFGYVGDVGSLPSLTQGLSALWSKPSEIIAWQTHSSQRSWTGWNGPYLIDQGLMGVDYSNDAWETPFEYNPDSDPATLISYGANRLPGGSELDADITLVIPKNRIQYSVHGLLLDKGDPYSGSLEVEINIPDPDTGGLTSKVYSMVPGDLGAFLFEKIPPGVRSLFFHLPTKASPSITYGPYIITVDHPHTLFVYGTAAAPLDLSAAP
jgi:type II secretion system protein G